MIGTDYKGAMNKQAKKNAIFRCDVFSERKNSKIRTKIVESFFESIHSNKQTNKVLNFTDFPLQTKKSISSVYDRDRLLRSNEQASKKECNFPVRCLF